jgi:uncharacterized membrane protein YecN with MAPEG domain
VRSLWRSTIISIPVTLLYGGLSVLLVTVLGANVSRLRSIYKAYIRDVPPAELLRPVRAHGNAAEWVPVGVLLLLILELSQAAGSALLHILGGMFFLGRVLHAYGVYAKSMVSAAGAVINYLTLLIMSAWAIWFHFVR